eukprot:1773367-Pyramimonas_sp.AAC.1
MRVRLQRKAPMTTRSTCRGKRSAQPRRHKVLCDTFSKALARSQSSMRKALSSPVASSALTAARHTQSVTVREVPVLKVPLSSSACCHFCSSGL